MIKRAKVSIHLLIDRSSLGTEKARLARARVPLAKGHEMALAAELRAAHRRAVREGRHEGQG